MSRSVKAKSAAGLSASSTAGSIPRHGPVRLPLTRLRHPSDPHRKKLDAERVAALASDIGARGLLNPILVRGPVDHDMYEVIAGDRRTYAHELLDRADIEAFVYPPDTDPLDIRTSENSLTEPLSPIEQGDVIRRYLERGLPMAHVALKMGHSELWCRDRRALLDYPEDIREAIDAGALPLSVAAVLVDIPNDEYRRSLLAEAIRTGANATTARVWLAHWNADGDRLALNHATVQDIIANRDKYVLKVRCEACDTEVPLEGTRTFRFCGKCSDSITNPPEA